VIEIAFKVMAIIHIGRASLHDNGKCPFPFKIDSPSYCNPSGYHFKCAPLHRHFYTVTELCDPEDVEVSLYCDYVRPCRRRNEPENCKALKYSRSSHGSNKTGYCMGIHYTSLIIILGTTSYIFADISLD